MPNTTIIPSMFDTVLSAVREAVNLIAPTFGPAGNKVLIHTPFCKGLYDDGVMIAKNLELPDLAKDAVWKQARNVAIRTNNREGDGTTGSLIMLRAILDEVARIPAHRRDYRKIERELKDALVEAVAQLKKAAIPVKTLSDLEKVARISYDDPTIAKTIAETWHKLGADGILTVGSSGTMETFSELTEGIGWEKGYLGGWMVTNPERMEAVVDKPLVFVTEDRLTSSADIVHVLNACFSQKQRNIVIVAEHIEPEALATVGINHKNVLNPETRQTGPGNIVCVNAPFTGEMRITFLEDLCLSTGAVLFGQAHGRRIDENLTIESFGKCERFTAKDDSCVLVGPKGDKKAIKKAMDQLLDAANAEKSEKKREALRTRMARLGNKIGVIRVGAATDQEESALRFKVEDAIHAVHSAFKGGVVAGGGHALSALRTGNPILDLALKAPHAQLLANVGMEPSEAQEGKTLNVVSGKSGKFLDVGVCDPVNVLIAALESSVSIACLLLTTSGGVTEPPPELKRESMAG